MLMQKIDKKGQIGWKIVKDVLAIQQMLGISDKDLARMADGEISQSTIVWWRWKLKQGGPMYPRYSSIVVVLDAMGHKVKIVTDRKGRNW